MWRIWFDSAPGSVRTKLTTATTDEVCLLAFHTSCAVPGLFGIRHGGNSKASVTGRKGHQKVKLYSFCLFLRL